MTIDLDALEKLEDDRFIRDYPEAVRRGDWERIARLLSGRLRQMDKRAKAANARADSLIAELKEARGKLSDLLDEAEDVFVCMADATGISRHNFPPPYVKARAFLARNGKGEG